MNRSTFIKSVLLTTMAMGTNNTIRSLASTFSYTGKTMPILFIGHGSPMNGIENNEFSNKWKELAKTIETPRAVLCISAHWLTKGTFVTAMQEPKTIHDFGGFPKKLFDVQYPAAGDLELAKETSSLVQLTTVELDHDWGLDHGTWTVVRHMYPDANIPVLQLSIDVHQAGQFHYNLGRELADLRKKGVLIIGSGNMVHNLRMVAWDKLNDDDYAYDWATEMNATFKQLILSRTHEKLIDYKKLGPSVMKAIPTPDHYYPLLYTLGLQVSSDEIEIFNDKTVGGSLTMTSVKIG